MDRMNYNLTILKSLSSLSGPYSDNQEILRAYLQLAPAYLLLDGSHKTDPETGVSQWAMGFDRIMDVLAALHASSQLELLTVEAVRNALAECWSSSESISPTTVVQEKIKALAGRLRRLMDDPEASRLCFRSQPMDLDFLH